jgi:hypothetical protein
MDSGARRGLRSATVMFSHGEFDETPLTIVIGITTLWVRGITEKEMALIPATIPSLWGLNPVRPSEPL